MYNFFKKRVLLSASQYDFSSDRRRLIPYEQDGKIGFLNHDAEVSIYCKFDTARGEFYNQNDLVIVGVIKQGQERIHDDMAYGVIDYCGNFILNLDYRSILFSDDHQYITAQRYGTFAPVVYSRKGDIVIAEKEYDWMDGFWKGFARVQHNGKYGVIDTHNQIVLPIEYDKIWNFYGKQYDSIVVVRNGVSTKVSFSSLKPRCNFSQSPTYICDDEDDYGTHYGEYEGSYAQDVMGYSDDVINDVFEGDPDAYWNID